MKISTWLVGAALVGLGAGMTVGASPAWARPRADIIYSSPHQPTGGDFTVIGPVADYGSDLVGATFPDESLPLPTCSAKCSTIFRLVPPPLTSGRWTKEVLHTFDPATEGIGFSYPSIAPVVDTVGTIYGVNRIYPALSNEKTPEVVWKLSPPVAPSTTWSYSVVGNFTMGVGNANGGITDIAVSKTGVVYVSTNHTYSIRNPEIIHGGSIYSLTPSGGIYVKATVHYFSISEHYAAKAFTLLDETKIIGFTDQSDEYPDVQIPGTVFLLQLVGGTWKYHELHDLASCYGGPSSCLFEGPIVVDSNRNIFIAAGYGGSTGDGGIVEISPPAPGQTAWTETTIYDGFDRSTGGPVGPASGLTPDKRTGSLFGTLLYGGTGPAADGSLGLGGATYRLDPPATGSGQWTLTVLHDFKNGDPYSALVYGRSGLLYGTSSHQGGKGGRGFIYRQTPY